MKGYHREMEVQGREVTQLAGRRVRIQTQAT